MATRQYIGARYVPKFYDYNGSPNWRPGVEYENLTIVTRNGNSYTSKKPVPSSIGEPENNPEYWVSTGLYNEQVEAYRQLTQALASRVDEVATDITDETTARENADNTFDGRITALENGRELNLSARRFLFVGDSYIASHNNTCVEIACNSLGITNFENISVSGSAFYNGTFLQQISGYTGDKDTITDIFVIGGMNDSIYTTNESTLTNSIADFMAYAKANYPNAVVSVCFAAHALDSSPVLADRNWTKRQWAHYMYEKSVIPNGGRFYGDLWESLCVTISNLSDDQLHPSNYGQSDMALMLCKYITNGEFNPSYPPYFIGGIAGSNYTVSNGVVSFGIGTTTVNMANQTIRSNARVDISNTMNVYVNKEFTCPCLVRIYGANSEGHKNAYGNLVLSGRTCYIRLDTVNSNGYYDLAFNANGAITLTGICVDIPINYFM